MLEDLCAEARARPKKQDGASLLSITTIHVVEEGVVLRRKEN